MTEKRFTRIRIGVVFFILIITGIIYLLLPVLAVNWMRTPFPGFFLDPNLIVNDSADPNWPAQDAGRDVSYPERVMAVGDTAVSTQAEFNNILAEHRVGDVIQITFEQPPPTSAIPANPNIEFPRTVDIPLIQFTLNDLWINFVILYVTGIMIFAIGVWAFWARPQAEAAQVFALSMAFTALAIGCIFDSLTAKYFVRLWLVALSIACGLTILVASVFPHQARVFSRFTPLKWLLFLPGVLTGVWAQIVLYDAADPWRYAISWRFLFLWNAIALIIAFSIIGYRAFRSPSPTVRQQTRIMLAGGVLAFTPIAIFFLGIAMGADLENYPSAFYIPMIVIFPLSVGYTIIRYRLLDVEVVLRRGLTYVLMAAILVGSFMLVLGAITSAFGTRLDIGTFVLLAVAIVIVIILYDPMRSRLQSGVDQMLFSEPMALDRLLHEYNRELPDAVNVDQVANKLMKYVSTGVPNTTSYLYLPDNQMSCYSSFTNHTDVLMMSDSTFVHYLREVDGAIDLTEERTWPEALRPYQETITAMEASVIVPMNNGKELLGWLTLSDKEGGQHLRQAEVTYVNTLAVQSLIGLERANVIRRLETQIAEQNRLSQFSQALNFTIEMDVLLELIYINFQRLLGIEDFFIVLRSPNSGRLYKLFHIENDERLHEEEGRDQFVVDPDIDKVVSTAQRMVKKDENGRTWLAAPLNAGADTIGVIYTFFRDPNAVVPERQQYLFSVFSDQAATALERMETNRRLQERAQQLEIINELTISLTSTIELDALLELILDKAMELLNTEAGTFMVAIPDTGELEFKVVRGPASENLVGTRLPVGTGLAGTAAQTGRTVIVNRVHDDERWFANVDENTAYDTQSILTVPLIRQNTALGVLQVINKRNGGQFAEEDKRLLMAFAGQAVVAMENARLLEQTDLALKDSVDELSMLQQLDRDLNTTLDLTHVLNLTLDRTIAICKSDAGAILLLDEEGHPYRIVTRGYDSWFDPYDIDVESGLIGKVIETEEPYITGDVHKEPDYVTANSKTKSQMTLPLTNKQQLIGIISIESFHEDAYAPLDVETAVRVTNHAAVAITNAVLYEQINEANLAKSEFVSMVSHELKTPMTSMRGYTDLLLSGMTGELNDQQRNFLETIAANIQRMGQQIQDLTDISRIETGRLHIVAEPTSIIDVMNETLQTVKPLCEEKDVRLHLQLPDDLPMVFVDKNRLVQVMTNLLSNACKYSPSDTDVKVIFEEKTLEQENGHDPKHMIQCSVADQGYGISETDQKKLFTKFFRSEDPNIRQAKGTGLGLSITKGIIEIQGGEIWVESEIGQGTTFAFTMPRVQP